MSKKYIYINIHYISYESFSKYIDDLYKKYDPSKTELNYRFLRNFTGRTDEKLYSLKEKQKTIGKIGTSTTLIDLGTNFGKLQTYYDGNKLEARDNFVSVRANGVMKFY